MTYNPATLGQSLLIYAEKGAVENLHPSIAVTPAYFEQVKIEWKMEKTILC